MLTKISSSITQVIACVEVKIMSQIIPNSHSQFTDARRRCKIDMHGTSFLTILTL